MGISSRQLLCLAITGLTLLSGGCHRSDPRLKASIEGLKWSGGNTEDRRVRDALRDALEKSTPATLATPTLVSAVARIVPEHGMLKLDWIGSEPSADAVRILFPDGTTADFPLDPVEIAYNKSMSATLLIYGAAEFAERDQPAAWAHIVAAQGNKIAPRAVLLQDFKPVSPEIRLLYLTPSPASAPATTEADPGKMIGTIDAAGHASIYLLKHDINAGDTLSPGDIYAGTFDTRAGTGISEASFIDPTGPTAYVGRRFAANYSANDTLSTSMFSPPAATTPSTHPAVQ